MIIHEKKRSGYGPTLGFLASQGVFVLKSPMVLMVDPSKLADAHCPAW